MLCGGSASRKPAAGAGEGPSVIASWLRSGLSPQRRGGPTPFSLLIPPCVAQDATLFAGLHVPGQATIAAHDAREASLPIIDMHTHIFPDRLAATAVATVCRACGIAPCFDGTLGGLRSFMRHADIARSVVQPVASRASQVRSINDWVAALGDDSIIPFAAMHPDLPDPTAEIERLAAIGIPGFKLHPEYQGFSPDETRLDPLYAAAARHGLIAYFHAGEDIALPAVHSTPETFARLLDRHPDLTVVLAHMGGWRQWGEVQRHLAGRDVYLDTSFTLPYLGEERFAELVEAHGAHRILFGSDAPWGDLSRDLAQLGAMTFSEQDLDAILWRNAARLLGLSAEAVLAPE